MKSESKIENTVITLVFKKWLTLGSLLREALILYNQVCKAVEWEDRERKGGSLF